MREEAPVLEVRRQKGSYLFDSNGKRYLDFVMGWCVGNFGWSNRTIEASLKSYSGPDYIFPEYGYSGWDELASLIISIAPPGLTKCLRATGGSEAVDIAVQAALIHTGRKEFLSLEGSYHGNTLATMSVGSTQVREQVRAGLSHCHKINPPLHQRAVERIDARLKTRRIAAMIMEPISINLGVLLPGKAFMQRIRQLCRRYGTLFIADEVACGFGRTGAIFACEHFDLRPDILCLGKAITGGVAGMGATLTTAPVAKTMSQQGSFYSTYGWHPRSTAVAIATIKYIIANRDKLLAGVADISGYFGSRLSEMPFRHVVALRIKGLAIAVDVGDDDYADAIATRCRRAGLLITTQGSAVLLLPPLTVSRAEAKRGLDIVARSIG